MSARDVRTLRGEGIPGDRDVADVLASDGLFVTGGDGTRYYVGWAEDASRICAWRGDDDKPAAVFEDDEAASVPRVIDWLRDVACAEWGATTAYGGATPPNAPPPT